MRIENGGWRIENGGWRMENGGLRIENGLLGVRVKGGVLGFYRSAGRRSCGNLIEHRSGGLRGRFTVYRLRLPFTVYVYVLP